MENAMKLRALPDEFTRVFEDNLGKHHTRKAAYEATEKLHESLTGGRCYGDYESYRISRTQSRNRKIKKRRGTT